MRTITTTHTVYTYDELTPEAQAHALDEIRTAAYSDPEFFWAESETEEFTEQLGFLGFDITDNRGHNQLYWSGFSSQGDGACFAGRWFASEADFDKVAEKWCESESTKELRRITAELAGIVRNYPDASATITHFDRYCHPYSVRFEVDPGEPDIDDYLATYLDTDQWKEDFPESDFIEACRDLMKYHYRNLKAEWDYEISDATLIARLRDDREFDEDGDPA
jgi:hypothetical protein